MMALPRTGGATGGSDPSCGRLWWTQDVFSLYGEPLEPSALSQEASLMCTQLGPWIDFPCEQARDVSQLGVSLRQLGARAQGSLAVDRVGSRRVAPHDHRRAVEVGEEGGKRIAASDLGAIGGEQIEPASVVHRVPAP
jgi:hypothetical protein